MRQIAPDGAGSVDKFGYIIDFLPRHPLAQKSGLVPRHRQVLYDAIGAGLHPCHWCATPVAWEDPQPHGLQVDHLDADKQNNAVTNLVPACKPCNFLRAVAGNPLDFVRDVT